MEGLLAAFKFEYQETSRKEAGLLMEELKSTKAQSLKLAEELQAIKGARINTSHEKYNEKFDELKSLMSQELAAFARAKLHVTAEKNLKPAWLDE